MVGDRLVEGAPVDTRHGVGTASGRWPQETGELPEQLLVRNRKYFNNLIKQDHQTFNQRLRPMLGLKSFESATIILSGIELAEKIKKGQFKLSKLGGAASAMMPEIRQAALAA